MVVVRILIIDIDNDDDGDNLSLSLSHFFYPIISFNLIIGAFLIPYLICLIFTGIPIFIMETTFGQLLGRGFLSIWQICPILKGVGYSSLILLLWMNTYYIVVIAWSLYYLIHSFLPNLPWSTCNHEFNTEYCRTEQDLSIVKESQHLVCSDLNVNEDTTTNCTTNMIMNNFTSPVNEYWQ